MWLHFRSQLPCERNTLPNLRNEAMQTQQTTYAFLPLSPRFIRYNTEMPTELILKHVRLNRNGCR